MGKKMIFLALCGALAACSSDNPPVVPVDDGTLFKQSYIQCYCNGKFYSMLESEPQEYLQVVRERDNAHMHYSPEWVETTIAQEQQVRDFVQYATANNDLSYDRREARTLLAASADNFKEVHITCPGADWDKGHPAGSLLDNITTLTVTSYAEFIRKNYTGEESKTISKLTNAYTEADLAVLHPSLKFTFDQFPEKSGKYTLKVTLVTTDDRELQVTGTVYINPRY